MLRRRPLTRIAWGAIPLALLLASALSSQQVPTRLTLEDALQIAEQNNPNYLATRNDVDVDDWNVRAAYGALTPSLSVGGNVGWVGAGEQNFGGGIIGSDLGVTDQPNFYSSGYSAGLNWNLSGNEWYGPATARAGRRVTESRIDETRILLQSQVTAAYLEVLRQSDEVELANQQLERSRFNLRLAEAQAELGSSTLLDVRQAEVQVGRSEVALLQAETAQETANLRLLQQMGVDLSARPELVTEFGLEAPEYELDALYRRAVEDNPVLRTRRETVEADRVGVKVARSAYLPSLNFDSRISGFTREASNVDGQIQRAQAGVASQVASCQSTNDLYSRLANPLPAIDCSQFVFTDAMRQGIIDANDAFPFNFLTSPPSATLSISFPLFQGLSRQQRLETAQTQLRDSEHRVREQELALEADLAVNLAQVRTAWQSAEIEDRNVGLADEQLRLATERYRLGGIPFLDLIEAETVKAQADRDRLNAIYAYHDAITNLEAVVGRPLRGR